MTPIKHLCTAAVLGLALTSTASAETLTGISYGDRARNTLDLHLPDGVENPPVVVFIHGGRWFRNDSTQIELHNRVPMLLDAGIAIASINYTFSDEAIWPAQLDDLRAAFDFVRENGDTYGYNADQIAAWGQSSGAHLALWAVFDMAANAPDAQVDALVSWYAPSDLFALIPDRAADTVPDREGMDVEPTPESLLIGAPVQENRELADDASPTLYLASVPDEAPIPHTLLVHGTADFVVSPLQTERLYAAMEGRAGVESVQYRAVEGAGHGRDPFDPEVQPVIDFLLGVFAE